MTEKEIYKEVLLEYNKLIESYSSNNDQYIDLLDKINLIETEISYLNALPDNFLEMATFVPSNDKINMIITVNPDANKIGDPYFKVFFGKSVTSAKFMCRILFLKSIFIKPHKTPIPVLTKLKGSIKDKIIDFLNEPSDHSKYKKWDSLKNMWNYEHHIYYDNSIDRYMSGKYDELYKNNPSYLPSALTMPDYKLFP